MGFTPEGLSRIGAFVQRDVDEGRIPGAAMLIVDRGEPVMRRAWGARDPQAAMTETDIFRINSMTKPMVSLVALMLMEEGLLRLEQKVSDFIPAFASLGVGTCTDGAWTTERPAFEMTLQDLLRHTSGIGYGTFGDAPLARLYRERGLVDGDFDTVEFVARLAQLPLAFAPGARREYGHSTDVLGRVVEIVTGQSLGEVLAQRLIRPLGMRDTGFHVADAADHERIAEPFADDQPFGNALPNPRVARRFESAGGGLVSTMDDYARFCRLVLAGGTLDGRRYVARSTMALMTADHIGPGSGVAVSPRSMLGAAYGFGLGFAVRIHVGGGSTPGSVGELHWSGICGTFFWIDPAEDLFVIFMSQSTSQRLRLRSALRGLVYGARSDAVAVS